jgi:VIT1/CCC1 family predicted Fe2+/Mn2+ transporter
VRRHPRRVEEARVLPPERKRARITAYVYGNILVLAAVATATPATIENGHAAVVVAATTITTYLAHILAHEVGEAVMNEQLETEREELRDALPIISSGSIPIVLLLAGAVTDSVDSGFAELVAMGVVIFRLAVTGTLVARLGGEPSPRRAVWGGFALAAIGILIATLKAVFLH